MEKQFATTTLTPQVTLDVKGDLTLKGWDESQITAKSPSLDDLTLHQDGEQTFISCTQDCVVRVPFGARVQIPHVGGHATLKSLDGSLTIQQISGHLTMRSVGPTTIERVHGHLTAKNIAGDLQVGVVNGNATVKDVQGSLIVREAVNGNLTLNDVDGNASATVNGNVMLSFDPAPGNHYTFEARGNLLCRIPEDASVRVSIPRAARLLVRMPEAKISPLGQAPLDFTLGEGDAELTLSANGEVLLSGQPPELDMEDLEVDVGEDFESMAESISQQVTQQIEAQMEALEHQLEAQMEQLTASFGTAGFSPEHAERIAQRAREASERAAARAQEKIQRAQEKLQRKLEAVRRRAEAKARSAERVASDRRRRIEFQWGPPPPPHAPHHETPKEPVSEEERLMILQMLEQQKISVDEAEKLLSALEGRSG